MFPPNQSEHDRGSEEEHCPGAKCNKINAVIVIGEGDCWKELTNLMIDIIYAAIVNIIIKFIAVAVDTAEGCV